MPGGPVALARRGPAAVPGPAHARTTEAETDSHGWWPLSHAYCGLQYCAQVRASQTPGNFPSAACETSMTSRAGLLSYVRDESRTGNGRARRDSGDRPGGWLGLGGGSIAGMSSVTGSVPSVTCWPWCMIGIGSPDSSE
jgi:hypothetical protein